MENAFKFGLFRKLSLNKKIPIKSLNLSSLKNSLKKSFTGSAIKKILLLNSFILLKYLASKYQQKRVFCSSPRKYTSHSDLNFLFKYEKNLFENKKCPKIIYLSSFAESEEEISKLKSNFEKIHNKYSDIESYFLNVFRNFSNLSELENILDNYGTSLSTLFPELSFIDKENKKEISEDEKINLIKNQLKVKPYLLFNKYGDVKAYTQKEFDNIAEAELIYNYFERFSILNNKTDFLFMNDYDNIFLIFLDGKKINYTHPNFKIFRKIFFNLNFFNVKFFVCTDEHRELFNLRDDEQVQNNLFLLKRRNVFDSVSEAGRKGKGKETHAEKGDNVLQYKEFNVEGEKFELFNLTQDLQKSLGLDLGNNASKEAIKQKLNVEDQVFNKALMNILLEKTNFIYHTNTYFKHRQGLEIINFYVKDMDAYILYTNLKNPENIYKLNNFLNVFRKAKTLIAKPFTVIVVDNERYPKNTIFKLFAEKSFDLNQESLKNTKYDEKFTNYEAKFLKKLRVKNPSETDILNLINKKDITIEESYVFNKKQNPENLQNISYLNFDVLLNFKKAKKNSNSKKYVFILNEDTDLNRNLLVKAEKLAKLNPDNNYFVMVGSEENKKFLKEKYGIEFNTLPQMIRLLDNSEKKENKDDSAEKPKVAVFPMNDLLSYRIDLETLNEKVGSLI